MQGGDFVKKILILLVGIIVIVMCCGCKRREFPEFAETPEESEVPEYPDVVNSISSGRDQYLTVIAYREEIEDKEAFAKELIQMCVDNSFKTIKFSTDRGYATSLRMTVYLNEEDWQNNVVVMEIEYDSESLNGEYDIVNNPEMFLLSIK